MAAVAWKAHLTMTPKGSHNRFNTPPHDRDGFWSRELDVIPNEWGDAPGRWPNIEPRTCPQGTVAGLAEGNWIAVPVPVPVAATRNLSSDLVVQSSRSVLSVQLLALYRLSMVPGAWVFKGIRQGCFFYVCFGRYWGGSKLEKMKMQNAPELPV